MKFMVDMEDSDWLLQGCSGTISKHGRAQSRGIENYWALARAGFRLRLACRGGRCNGGGGT